MNQPIRIPEIMNAVGIEGGEGPAEALKLVTLPTPKPETAFLVLAPVVAVGFYAAGHVATGFMPLVCHLFRFAT